MGRVALRRASRQLCTVRSYSTVQDIPRSAASFIDAAPPAEAPSRSVFDDAVAATAPRFDWTKEEISQIHQKPLMELAYAAV
jgi:biotin synthase